MGDIFHKMNVVGRILRCLAPKIPIPGLHTPYTPLTLNVGRTCEYDGIVSFLSCGKCDRIVNPARLEKEGWHIMGREQWHGMAGSSG